MSTWIRDESKKSWAQSFCEKVLKCGPIPPHVAVIMDGNRRFADKNNYKRSVGHLLGFNKVTETLEWCMSLGITEVTLYAFSIENFKRSKEEIDSLMELARQKFSALLAERDLINKHGLCLRIIGNMEHLPRDLQKLFAEGINGTKDNKKAFLNICCPYTSREEMTHVMRQLVNGVDLGLIKEGDIDEDIFDRCLYTRHSMEPDIIIRTSGEVRLSDFLLWQSAYSVLSFSKVLWPEYTHWHFYAGIIFYQQNYKTIQKAKEERVERRRCTRMEMDACEALKRLGHPTDQENTNQRIVENLEQNSEKEPKVELRPDFPSNISKAEYSPVLSEVTKERLERVSNFLSFLENEYDRKILSLTEKDVVTATNVSSEQNGSVSLPNGTGLSVS